MDYTTLSLAEVRAALEDIAREAQTVFAGLDGQQLNWRPDAKRWSVAQCFEHLHGTNSLMVAAAKRALDPSQPRTVWQRLPVMPAITGRFMVRSLGPKITRTFPAPPQSRPSTSEIASDIVSRFVAQQRDIATWIPTLNDRQAAVAVMTSPFLRFMTYSVLDACRLIAAHDRRHFEQARRVTQLPDFPKR